MGGIWKWVPYTGSIVIRPRSDVAPIRRVSNRLDRVGMPLERLANCGTSLSIPGSNGAIEGSRGDVASIKRVSNGPYRGSVPLERIA